MDIISIGDATIDTFMQIKDASVNCSLDRKGCKLLLNYADKIVVHKMSRTVAGNAANNAIGSARLGLKTTFCSIVGDDDNGKWIKKTIAKDGVNTRYMTVEKNRETNASTVINYKGERTILVYHAPRKYKLPKLPKSKWVYYTSVGDGHKQYNKDVIAYIKKSKAKLGYNPGSHQLITGLKTMQPVIKHTHVLFVNKEEAARILGKMSKIEKMLKKLQELGPPIVVITDGANGPYVRENHTNYHMGILDGPVVERTGAGDAFATGFISALHYEKSIPEAMCWASHNSTSVISKIGPQAGLLTKKQMESRVKKSKSCESIFTT